MEKGLILELHIMLTSWATSKDAKESSQEKLQPKESSKDDSLECLDDEDFFVWIFASLGGKQKKWYLRTQMAFQTIQKKKKTQN